jgi:hypothetical protein
MRIDTQQDEEFARISANLAEVTTKVIADKAKRLIEIDFVEVPGTETVEPMVVGYKAAQWAAYDLGVGRPAICWFVPADDPRAKLPMSAFKGTRESKRRFRDEAELMGKYHRDQPTVIYIRADLSARQTLETCLHETMHYAMAEKGMAYDERVAQDYGAVNALRLWGPQGPAGGQAAVWVLNAREFVRDHLSNW